MEHDDFDPICPNCGEPSRAVNRACDGCERLLSCYSEAPPFDLLWNVNHVLSLLHGGYQK